MSFPGMELCLLFCKMLQTAIENSLKLCFKPDPTLMSFQGNWSHRAATKHLTAKNKKKYGDNYLFLLTDPPTNREVLSSSLDVLMSTFKSSPHQVLNKFNHDRLGKMFFA